MGPDEPAVSEGGGVFRTSPRILGCYLSKFAHIFDEIIFLTRLYFTYLFFRQKITFGCLLSLRWLTRSHSQIAMIWEK